MKTNKELICIAPNCERHVYSRGLCISHYNMASKLVSEGKTNWNKLEANGKVLPVKGKQGARDGSTEWFLNETREENIQE
tara:strand:+ start:29713 stop:29952 length:240 start_codon:yes stop_codon:yes gene_type:complete